VTAAGESGGAPPYWPWAQVIRSCVRDRAPEELRADLGNGGAHLAQITPELRETLPDLAAPPPPRAGSEDSRFYLFDAAAVFLRNVAKRAPVVLVLDDVHAADGPSLLLLRFVADELREAAILVLATFRAAEARQVPAVHHLLGELAREATTLPLAGLGVALVIPRIERMAWKRWRRRCAKVRVARQNRWAWESSAPRDNPSSYTGIPQLDNSLLYVS